VKKSFVGKLMTISYFPVQCLHVHQTMLQKIERQEARVLGVGGVVSHRQGAAAIQKIIFNQM